MSEKLPWMTGDVENIPGEADGFSVGATSAPRRGSTLEGRVRVLLQNRGYRAFTNRVILDHEIDVWGEDENQRVVLVECKEYYAAGPVSASHVRNFFGKVYDIQQNYGENVYLAMFVSISGFTDAARALCERLGILAVDTNTLEILEQTTEDLTPRYSTLEDQALLELRKQRDQLYEEVTRRNLVRKLGQQIDDYRRILETKTLPSFLIPTTISNSFWYSLVDEIPFVGLPGSFKDFAAPWFPQVSHVVYEQRRLLGRRVMAIPTEHFEMNNGVVYVEVKDWKEVAMVPPAEAQPYLGHMIGRLVTTADHHELGVVTDLLVSYRRTGWMVESLKITSSHHLAARLAQKEFTIPSERVTLREEEDGWQIAAHVRVAL